MLSINVLTLLISPRIIDERKRPSSLNRSEVHEMNLCLSGERGCANGKENPFFWGGPASRRGEPKKAEDFTCSAPRAEP